MGKNPAIMGLNNLHESLEDIIAEQGDPPWSHRLVDSDHIMSMLICQAPGTENDRHYHLQDEWWIILQGEIDWEMENSDQVLEAKAGDIIFAPKNHFHLIKPKGSEKTVRLAISHPQEWHRHDRE